MTECAAIIGAQPFLRRLPAQQVERLTACARHISMPAGPRLFDEGAVHAACDADPGLGYALLDRFLGVAAHRLQATRARLIDVRLHPNAG